MQCNQLIRLAKDWYTHVNQETMAPARMMQFVDQHIKECTTCQQDPALPKEVEKIREHVLPESKLPRAFRAPNKTLTPEISPSFDGEKDGKDLEGGSTADGLL
uniref:hypothetical protein n=1 Tax=Candidatus Electrothrix sp. TaxID=2170559 RepID=UPI004056FB8C